MSNIYIQEPPTNGKVLLRTTVGDIDIELWSKEAPKACRNFVQLCMENYYDGTLFHRLVKGFIVQGGDPSGDGTGGESVYGHPFKDEFHTRLRFVRRGLVAMANSGKDDNGSQFFFTLAATPELQSKNTIFGKVTGNTLYNMLKLEESLVDQDDRPLYPHKIISTEIISNPFPDIEPRVIKKEPEKNIAEKPKIKIEKNYKLLSFGEEAEEEDAEVETVIQTYKGQSKSSHDLTNDPILSSVPAVVNDAEFSNKMSEKSTLDSIRNKLDKGKSDKLQTVQQNESIEGMANTEENNEALNKRKEIQREIKALKKELRGKKSTEEQNNLQETVNKEAEVEENSVLLEYHKQLEKYNNISKKISRKGTSEREQQTLKYLEKFKNKLESAKQTVQEKDDSLSEDDDNQTWLVHCLRAEEQKVVLAKDANLPTADRYELSDPRNPLNERRRKKRKH